MAMHILTATASLTWHVFLAMAIFLFTILDEIMVIVFSLMYLISQRSSIQTSPDVMPLLPMPVKATISHNTTYTDTSNSSNTSISNTLPDVLLNSVVLDNKFTQTLPDTCINRISPKIKRLTSISSASEKEGRLVKSMEELYNKNYDHLRSNMKPNSKSMES
jgi:hypothetical protein